MEKKKCASCHHTTFFVWAKDLALQSGHKLDKDLLKEQRTWLIDSLLKERKPDPKKPDSVKPGELIGDKNIEGVSQLLVSPVAEHIPGESKQQLVNIITSNQSESGNWKPGGQLPRQERPEKETQFTTNQWALLAAGEALETAAEIGKTSDSNVSTEWFAMRVILNPEDETSVKALLDRQNKDGGWSWKDGEPSCPMGTGQSLLALSKCKTSVDLSKAMHRGRSYLTDTQDAEGHWETLSTKDREETTEVSNFWGTAWAVIGLLESQPKIDGQ